MSYSASLRHFIASPVEELTRRPAQQVASLDLLRTVAVLLVITVHFSHAVIAQTGTTDAFSRLSFVRNGWIGVDLFFVLSGYLIGKQLWRELRDNGSVRLGQFVLKRGFRIWPLYFFFLIFVLAVLGRGSFPFGKWWSDAVFLTNYVNEGVVMGSWSLCTEEQFYILAPLAMLLGASFRLSFASYRRFLWFVLLLLPAIRLATWLWAGAGVLTHDPVLFGKYIYFRFHTHADGLVIGLLIANYEVAGLGPRRGGFLASIWAPALAAVVCGGCVAAQREILGFSGVSVAFGAVLWFLLARPAIGDHWVVRSRLFYILSRLSYGMYLNHEYMQATVASWAFEWLPSADPLQIPRHLIGLVAFVCSSTAVAAVTFCCIEAPFLRLRSRLLAPRGAGHSNEGGTPEGSGARESVANGPTMAHGNSLLAVGARPGIPEQREGGAR